ncbi:MAG: hypothetical protein IKK46_03605 [Clostridia bacterium]|nr:hypothetical protein [Clostridia bacterium]MBR3809367.1 hypothetical protein [Clostridia bacterium]
MKKIIIRFLINLQDKELTKKAEDANMKLITFCTDIILKLKGKNIYLTENEINEAVKSFLDTNPNG